MAVTNLPALDGYWSTVTVTNAGSGSQRFFRLLAY
jgi:hypothetical protein